MAGCATPTPKLYVPESELPKTKFVALEVTTYKSYKWEKFGENHIYNDPIPLTEEGAIFKEAFKKELEEKGFVVFDSVKKDTNNILLIKVSLSYKPATVPLLTIGIVACTVIIEKDGRAIWRLDTGTATDAPIIPVSRQIKKNLVHEHVVKYFLRDFN